MPNLGIHMSESDLTDPKPAFVQGVFETFVDLLAGTTREEINQPQIAGLSELTHPELHEESIPRLALFRATANLLEVSGCFNFRLDNLLRPSAKTFRWHLSGLINFAKFREERAITYTQFTSETDQLLDEKTNLDSKNADLSESVAELRIEKEAKMPEIKEVEGSCQSLEAEISIQSKQQASLLQQQEEEKEACANLQAQINTDRRTQAEVETDCEKFRSQIIKSPGRLEQEFASLKQLLEAEKAECISLEARRRGMQDRLGSFHRQGKELAKTVLILNDVAAHITKSKTVNDERETIQSKITGQRAEAQDLAVLQQHLHRQLKRIESRNSSVRHQQSVKNEAAQQALAATQGDLHVAQQEMVRINNELAGQQAELEAFREEMAAEATAHAAKMEGRQKVFQGLLSQVEIYNAKLLHSLK